MNSTNFLPNILFSSIQTADANKQSSLFQLISAHTQTTSFPFSISIPSGDYFLLLHTLNGCGKLLINQEVYTLTTNTLLLLDCQNACFRLDIAAEPWEYQILFATGGNYPLYFNYFPAQKPFLTSLTDYCETALYLNRLCNSSIIQSELYQLVNSNLINSILTSCVIAQNSKQSQSCSIPSYLLELKRIFDENFQQEHSLSDLAEQLKVNKYRLCREFGATFDMSPIQYLNHRRIQIAAELLFTTDLKIHEIGSKVGIENTNHFISLFRKIQGMTPLEYRKTCPIINIEKEIPYHDNL